VRKGTNQFTCMADNPANEAYVGLRILAIGDDAPVGDLSDQSCSNMNTKLTPAPAIIKASLRGPANTAFLMFAIGARGLLGQSFQRSPLNMTISLAFLAPNLVQAAVVGRLPSEGLSAG
jgi:hypothetical protein